MIEIIAVALYLIPVWNLAWSYEEVHDTAVTVLRDQEVEPTPGPVWILAFLLIALWPLWMLIEPLFLDGRDL